MRFYVRYRRVDGFIVQSGMCEAELFPLLEDNLHAMKETTGHLPPGEWKVINGQLVPFNESP